MYRRHSAPAVRTARATVTHLPCLVTCVMCDVLAVYAARILKLRVRHCIARPTSGGLAMRLKPARRHERKGTKWRQDAAKDVVDDGVAFLVVEAEHGENFREGDFEAEVGYPEGTLRVPSEYPPPRRLLTRVQSAVAGVEPPTSRLSDFRLVSDGLHRRGNTRPLFIYGF